MTTAQGRAVDSDHPQVLCVAGPGSGKTTVLTRRIARLLETVPAKKIAAITYTNAAARNIEERLATLSDIGSGDILMRTVTLGFSGTLHGFCLRMLKTYGASEGYGELTGVIDDDAARDLLETKAKAMGCKTPVAKLLALKRNGAPKDTKENYSTEQLVGLAYCDELRESGLLDFDLILTEFYRLLVTTSTMRGAIADRFDYFFVDEVQDSALVDWKIFHELPIRNKFFVGDPDQAIFGFRGGAPGLMLITRNDPRTQTILLEDNFRCSQEICSAANALISRNAGRIEKETASAVGPGGRVTVFGQTLNEGDEIAQVVGYMQHLNVDHAQTAILARTNNIATGFRDSLKAAGIPVVEPPKSELPSDWPFVRATIEMLAQPQNETLQFLFTIAAGVRSGKSPVYARKTAQGFMTELRSQGKTLATLCPPCRDLVDVTKFLDNEHVSFEARMIVAELITDLPSGSTVLDLALEVARTERTPPDTTTEGVTVTTIHAAKGREWDCVFLVGFEDEVIPGSAKSADIEEERRLAFVALTRARKLVHISHAASRRATWGPKPIQPHRPSRFLSELTP